MSSSVALPGFEPGQVSVTATPRELIVHASAKTERREEPAKERAQGPLVGIPEQRRLPAYRVGGADRCGEGVRDAGGWPSQDRRGESREERS